LKLISDCILKGYKTKIV